MSTSSPVKVFATRTSQELAEEVCNALKPRLPDVTLGKHEVETFSNDNILVKVENVRDRFVVVIHTQVPPVDTGIMELFHILDAIKNARAETILLVFAYMPYSRSDKKDQPRISTMGNVLPRTLSASPFAGRHGVENVILLDPHDPHIKHYFTPAADEITAIYLLIDFLKKEILTAHSSENCVVVFSDAGAVKRYSVIPQILNLKEAYIGKVRPDHKELPIVKRVVGEVRGKDCLLFDDEVLSGGTILGDAELLKKEGAKSICALIVHPILADRNLPDGRELIKRFENSPIERFIVTNSVPVLHKLQEARKFTVLSIAGLLAEAIKRAILGQSLTELYDLEAVNLYR